jgi:hypothetical protein
VSNVYSLKSTVEVFLPAAPTVKARGFERSRGRALNTEDSSLVTVVGGVFRVAAIDGVTPTARTQTVFGVDGAIWAAGVARTLLHGSGESLTNIAGCINSALYDKNIANSRDQRQVTLAIAEFSPADRASKTVTFLRAADCTAWAKRDGKWEEVFPGNVQTPETARAVNEWCEANKGVFGEPRYAMEEEVSGRPENWVTAALGRFAEAKTQHSCLTGISEFVLASDGARLSPEDPPAAIEEEPPLAGLDCTVIHVVL